MMLLFFLLTLFEFQLINPSFAMDCNNSPQPSGGRVSGAWWSQYSSWCSSCGGTPYQDSSGGGCRPGSNWGGRSSSSGSSTRSASPSAGSYGSGALPPSQQIMLDVMKGGIDQMFRQPSPEETAAKRQQEWAAEQARIAAEMERQRLIKEKNDKMDAEANKTLSLVSAEVAANTSDEDLLKEAPDPTPVPEPFNCKEKQELAHRLETEGLKRMDIHMGKTRKLIKQAEEGSTAADKEAAGIAGDLVAGKLADKMKDFMKSQETLKAMEKQLQQLRTRTSVSSADHEKLAHWIEEGVNGGNGVIDAYEKIKAAKAFNFSDPKNGPRKAQILKALEEFNSGFMADTGAWELAGEHLSKTLGPVGPVAFKTAVLGIKVAVNRGNKMISENDLNEQKYHLGNMMKTRSEMVQKIKNLKVEIKNKCNQ